MVGISLGKPATDGPYNTHFHRKISGLISPRLGRVAGPNGVTILATGVAIAACLAVAADWSIAAAIGIQCFSIASCADGEVARATGRVTKWGDYIDTAVDRLFEIALVICISASFESQINFTPWDHLTMQLLLGGVSALSLMSEKYRSAFAVGYPKVRMEPLFAWASSGSDARLLALSAVLLVRPADVRSSMVLLQFFAFICCANVAYRLFATYKELREQNESNES